MALLHVRGRYPLQAGGGLQGSVQEHIGAGGAGIGFERGQAGDHTHRTAGPAAARPPGQPVR